MKTHPLAYALASIAILAPWTAGSLDVPSVALTSCEIDTATPGSTCAFECLPGTAIRVEAVLNGTTGRNGTARVRATAVCHGDGQISCTASASSPACSAQTLWLADHAGSGACSVHTRALPAHVRCSSGTPGVRIGDAGPADRQA